MMKTSVEAEQAFYTAFLSAVASAAMNGLSMSVTLKGDEAISGIPTVEGWTPDTPPYGQAVTIGHTTIIAQEVRGFSMLSPHA